MRERKRARVMARWQNETEPHRVAIFLAVLNISVKRGNPGAPGTWSPRRGVSREIAWARCNDPNGLY